MNDIVIMAESIGKSYLIGHRSSARYVTLRDTIADKARGLGAKIRISRSHAHKNMEEFWALKDVFFELRRGEKVGIIGRNGAGKSTLLKILSRITEPTKGRVTIRGRVASLLEVGTGFHPELTGRENIYLNGAILGMTRAEIKRKFDEIVDFAEVEKFLDTPVKHFSSGMYVRLAFAVAAHLEPEILVVDEVLAVGDIQFQKKCLGKMEDVSKRGRTILFVSHNMDAIRRLCSRCLLMQGRILKDDQPETVISFYTDNIIRKIPEYIQVEDRNKKINLRRVILLDSKKEIKSEFEYKQGFTAHIEYEINDPVKSCVVWCTIFTLEGALVFCTADYDMEPELLNERKQGHYQTEVYIPGGWLNAGHYSVVVGITSYIPLATNYDRVEACYFAIIDSGDYKLSEGADRTGMLKPMFPWKTSKMG